MVRGEYLIVVDSGDSCIAGSIPPSFIRPKFQVDNERGECGNAAIPLVD